MLKLALQKLDNVKKVGGQYQARCPCHDDKHASLSLSETPEGKLLAYCHAGCSFESIIKALDLQPDRINDTPIITATYDYTDSEGKLLYQVVRYHPKSFRQRRPDPGRKGKWLWNLNGTKSTLYKLPETLQAIAKHQLIFIVEGEKDVETLIKHGQAATSISGGVSSKWSPELIPLFEGAKVAIIPDQDEPGKKYAQYVASILHDWCASLKVISLPLKDVTEYLGNNPVDNLLNMVYNGKEYIPLNTITREEFESFKGVNRYLWNLVTNGRKKRKYNVYNI